MKPLIPDAALNQHTAILGKTGSGKTYRAKYLVERMLDKHRQTAVLDPTGAWWGLRLDADGKGRGYDVALLGGEHADIPLSERSGAAVARLITEQGANVVIDTSRFTVGEYTRWFIDFAGTLYTTIRAPLHLVIDEAHYFMPQGKTLDIDAGKMLHAGNRLMSGGRSKGVRGMLITQRPAKLHKDSLTCADTLVAMRVIAPQDRAAIKDWIDGAGDQVQGKTVLDSLAQLKRGEAWVWYPEGGFLERNSTPDIKTYDSSATPEHGAKAGPKVSEIKLDEVKAALAEAVKEAEANDPKALKRRIAELEKAAKGKQPTVTAQATKTVADPKAVGRAVAERDRFWAAEVAKLRKSSARLKSLPDVLRSVADAIEMVRSGLDAKPGEPPAPSVAPAGPVNTSIGPRPVRQPIRTVVSLPPREHTNGDGRRAAEQRVLDAIAQMEAIGVEEPSTAAIGLLAGIDPTGGYFSNTIGPLSTDGLVVRGSGSVKFTDAGRAAANPPEATLTLDDYHAMLRRVVEKKSGATARMLDAIIARGGSELTSESLGADVQIDHTGGYFSNTIGPLGTLGLIERRQGRVIPTDLLFPPALA